MLLSAAMSTKVICRDSNKEVRKNIGASSSISGSSSAQEPAKSSDQIVLGMLSQLLDRFVPQSPQTQNLDKHACKQTASVNHSSGLTSRARAWKRIRKPQLPMVLLHCLFKTLQQNRLAKLLYHIVLHCRACLLPSGITSQSQPFMALHYFSVFLRS